MTQVRDIAGLRADRAAAEASLEVARGQAQAERYLTLLEKPAGVCEGAGDRVAQLERDIAAIDSAIADLAQREEAERFGNALAELLELPKREREFAERQTQAEAALVAAETAGAAAVEREKSIRAAAQYGYRGEGRNFDPRQAIQYPNLTVAEQGLIAAIRDAKAAVAQVHRDRDMHVAQRRAYLLSAHPVLAAFVNG